MIDSKHITAALALVSGLLGDDAVQAIKQEYGMFSNAQRAQTTGNAATRAVQLVVGLTVGGLVAAFLIPVAIDEIVAVDTSSWGSGATSLWDILDMIVILAVFLFFIAIALRATGRL